MAGKLVAASCRCECWLLLRGCVCRWAAARPRDRHTRAFGSEWSISKPGQALPPPTGTAARPRFVVPSMREPAARSRRSRSPAKPSGPSGTLHTGGAFHCCTHPIQAPPPTGPAAKPHSQVSLVPQLTCRPPHRRCLVCWWVIGVALKVGQAPPLPPDTAVGHQPGAVCPALISNLARSGVCSMRT